jgi:hypothetical protein
VVEDRTVGGVQEFRCNWQGSSPHQWVRGMDLECNSKLEEYAVRTGRALDWRFLLGDPSQLLHTVARSTKNSKLLTYVKTSSRPQLDWHKRRKATKRKKSTAITTQGATDRELGRRASRPRTCKFILP